MPEGIKKIKRSAVFTDLGILEYKRALAVQVQTLESKIRQRTREDKIFFVEHPGVFTLGKRGGKKNLCVSENFLNRQNIELVQTDRGGDITYHCPGQAVLYPVIDLEKNKISVRDFVHGLEEIMKKTAGDFKISAYRNPRNHGIWVKNSKIGSVGISVKHGISIHGLALNINPDLEPFSWINPCGLTDISITSIKKEIEKSNKDYDFSMEKIKKAFKHYFSSVFKFKIKTQKPGD